MQTIRTDVVVVGLGAMGAAVTDQLACRGVAVVGVDRFAPPHDRGSSHGETRITRQAVGEGAAYVPFVLASHRHWRELESACGESLFEACGAVVIAGAAGRGSHHGKQDFFATTIATAERFAIEHRCLDRDELVARFPQFAGMHRDQHAYFEPGGGYLRPERCIAAQLARAERASATLLVDTKVERIDSRPGGVRVITDKAVIEADRAVVAAGAWATDLLGAPFERLLTVRRQTLHWFGLGADARFPADSPVHIWMHGAGDADYFYGFPPLLGERSVKVATEQDQVATHADQLDRQVAAKESQALFEAHLRGRLAGVSSRVVDAAACLYTVTPDQGFILDDHPTMPGVFVVSACSGHGFKHSAGIGQAVAQRLCGAESEFDLAPFALERFDS
ncbi:N-methyl-L-tryptophan oxidase [Halotalea alkalilenta]|uniref:N-methyl-L-tryptophan oxidase n=1 Tax=Halotalea alkalilenta TaxID=376489 RepID=UPI0004827E46|nr:N-methyl-L-tryptophan oxidase [Halotalea alkalilenta]